MKFTFASILNFIIINLVLITIDPAFSFSGDVKQPIYIESDMQSVDMEKNIIDFTGNVIFTQGTIRITSDKVVIIHDKNKKNKDTIESCGNPCAFYQMQDNGKPIKGHALKIYYNPLEDIIVLSGNAYIEQLNSNITGNKIIYLIKLHKITAYGGNKKRVTTILLPSQLRQGKINS